MDVILSMVSKKVAIPDKMVLDTALISSEKTQDKAKQRPYAKTMIN